MRGRAAGATGLTLNGRPVRLLDEQFDETVTLVPGRNAIELEAVDLVGNARVESFDGAARPAPARAGRLRGHARSRRTRASRSRSRCGPADPSGLRKAAPFKVRVAGIDYGEFLELGGDGGTYRATLLLPRDAVGPVTLREVEIEDYAGNRARFAFDR